MQQLKVYSKFTINLICQNVNIIVDKLWTE